MELLQPICGLLIHLKVAVLAYMAEISWITGNEFSSLLHLLQTLQCLFLL